MFSNSLIRALCSAASPTRTLHVRERGEEGGRREGEKGRRRDGETVIGGIRREKSKGKADSISRQRETTKAASETKKKGAYILYYLQSY